MTAAAAAVLVVAIGGGVVLGRSSAPDQPLAQPSAAVTTNPPGTKIASATDPRTGAKLSVAVLPAAG